MKTIYSEGKTTYYVRGVRFFNDKDKRNGKEKARQYCLDNFISENEIITFDSMLECDRYEYLKEQPNIKNLNHHQTIKVQDEFINANGDLIPQITYQADFVYYDTDKNLTIVEDVKGQSIFTDSRFEIMKQVFDKIFKDQHLYIKIVIYRNKQWVEWKIGDKKKPQKLIKKQREQIKNLKKENHEKEILENKRNREIKRIKELEQKDKLTKKEKERLFTLKNRWGI